MASQMRGTEGKIVGRTLAMSSINTWLTSLE